MYSTQNTSPAKRLPSCDDLAHINPWQKQETLSDANHLLENYSMVVKTSSIVSLHSRFQFIHQMKFKNKHIQ